MPSLPIIQRALQQALLAAAIAAPLAAQSGTPQARVVPSVQASPRTGVVELDGALDEASWTAAAPASGFTQQVPDEGKPATQRTEVRFVYDDEALYIGARMYDSLGAAGVRTRLARRDQQPEGDYIQLVFDTFHDHQGRTVLQVNPSGVRYDAGQASPSADPSWDPIWRAATRVDSLGWTAEMRIPWQQLRFSRDSAQTWGMQIWRFTERLNENSMWSFWGRQEAGGPALFGHLEGLRIDRRPGGWEVLPYTVARASRVRPTQPGSPFQDPSAYDVRGGVDVKALLGSNLTLSATINPDFGQVEQDPATVNLSAFENYFEEKRPFFVEGSGLLSFGGLNCISCSNVSGMSLFYSRRVGRSPQGSLPGGLAYTEVPRNTRLLGAAKLTGRTAGGWQIGALEAVTARSVAEVQDTFGMRRLYPVEPASNYAMARVKRTMRGGRVTVGAMATSVLRRMSGDDEVLRSQLTSHAEAVGVDWNATWVNDTYRLMGNFAMSQVGGDSLAINRVQRSSARYFDRPDRAQGSNGVFSDRYDPSLTSLRGYGGYLRMAKQAGAVHWETAVNYRSPGFEVNDMAFLTRADYVWMNANLFRQWTKPTRWYREFYVGGGGQQQFNYDGDLTDRQIQAFTGGELPNFWSWQLFALARPEVYDDRLTRRGPVVKRPAAQFTEMQISSDPRKRVVLSVSPNFSRDAEGYSSYYVGTNVRVKPATNVEFTMGPSIERSSDGAQYVRGFGDATATDFFGRRVVFADIDQRTLSMNTRLRWTFTPDLTLELFAQPFVATGEYSNFKEFVRPRTSEKREFDARQLTVASESGGRVERYSLDPDRDAATANFEFDNPDFNVRSLRGNAVLRWEYRPGSTLFFVWQQERSGSELTGDFAWNRDSSALFRDHPDNIFVIKASYWFGR
jgi:hypothetical protein